jgi:PEP-CTERM/exosortase A-associated glycosyltransferase
MGIAPCVLTGPLHQLENPLASDALLDGIPHLRTPIQGRLAFKAIRDRWTILRELSVIRLLRRRIVSLLRRRDFDIVHAHSPALCGLAAAQAARRFGLPFVYEIRAFWEDGAISNNKLGQISLRYCLGRGLETYVARRADAIVGIAKPILQDLQTRGIPKEKLFHVPNGVDVARFAPRPRDASLAAKLGLGGTLTLGFLGTLFPWEGISWLVRAAAVLRKNGLVFKLLILGDGADGPEVKKSIRNADAEKYVSFVGAVPHDQVEHYYSLIDVMVYPRLSVRLTELVTPLKPLEAMALGKAILASSVGGIRELIEADVTGVLFEPENITDFCRKASMLLLDVDLRNTLGRNARQSICAEKDWKVVTCRYQAVYDAAIGNARLQT